MTSVREEIEEQRRLVQKKKIRYGLDCSLYYHRWINSRILDRLAPDPNLAVLDCGCGTGILLPTLQRRYKTTIGLDLCIYNLLEARTLDHSVPLLSGDIEQLPLAPQSFDQVICRDSLHHLPDVGLAFRRLFETLKDGGDLIIFEPIQDAYTLHLLRVMTRRCTADTYTAKEWIDAAEAAGFRIVTWFNLGYLALPLLGYPEVTQIMRHMPFRMPLAKLLVHVDNLLARLPYIRTYSWKAVFHFSKPARAM